MSKQLGIVIGAVGALVVIGTAAYMLFLNPQSSDRQSSADITESTQQDSTTANSLRELLGLGKNVTCTMTYPKGNGSGTVYVAGERVRGDFNTPGPEGEMMESHMIRDNEYGYFWTGAEGTKIKIDETQQAETTEKSQQESVDLDEEVDMDCSSWSVDNSMFNVPQGVEFTDLSEAMMMMQGEAGQNLEGLQSICDQIEDPQAKAACLSNINP
jgi:hypothetical protein